MDVPAVPSPARDLPGYTLLRHLAAGGMADVFVAIQHSLGRQVAVKIVRAGDTALAARFQREARLVAGLNHSHIVPVYDIGRLADGRPYLSMELLPGGDLRQRIRDGLGEAEILRIMRQLARGLLCIHERGIVHRDIKPANILFRANGDAVLCDFGVARAGDIDGELTQAGAVIGSPAYSSPEQIGARPLDGRSDLYSLGVVLLEMLTGRNPFRGGDYTETAINQAQLSPPLLPGRLSRWQPLLDRLLAKKPERRYADAAALLAALDALDSAALPTVHDPDRTLVNRPAPAITSGAVWLRRQLACVTLGLVLVLAGLAGGRQDVRDPQVEAWLVQADLRLAQDLLTTPAGDSAVFYYRQVLARDAGNAAARRGLAAVAARYAELAHTARKRGARAQAHDYVARGLAVEPGHPALLALYEQMLATRSRGGAQLVNGRTGF